MGGGGGLLPHPSLSGLTPWMQFCVCVCVCVDGASEQWPPLLPLQGSTNCLACVCVWLSKPSVKVGLPELIYLFQMP